MGARWPEAISHASNPTPIDKPTDDDDTFKT